MTELYPSDAELNALSGTVDGEQEVLFIAAGESPYYTSFYKMLHRLLAVARRAGDLRVHKDGALTFGVRAGKFMDGETARSYAGASAQPLTDNATNCIYLTAAGTLTVSTSGFPAAGTTPHLPLATIVTSGGAYDHQDVTDYRGMAIFRCASAMSPADQNEAHSFLAATDLTGAEAETLSDGSNADSLHRHGAAGLEDDAVATDKLADDAVTQDKIADAAVGEAQLATDAVTNDKIAPDAVDGDKIAAAAVGREHLGGNLSDLIFRLEVTHGQESSDTIAGEIQVQDADGNDVTGNFRVRFWLSETQYGEPTESGTVSLSTGTILHTVTANADYEAITSDEGLVELSVEISGSATRYLMAETSGNILISTQMSWS